MTKTNKYAYHCVRTAGLWQVHHPAFGTVATIFTPDVTEHVAKMVTARLNFVEDLMVQFPGFADDRYVSVGDLVDFVSAWLADPAMKGPKT